MKNNKGMVSVIVPIYNSQEYLNDLVNSLSAQSYSNFEVIFVNDGSTDDSLNLLKILLENKQFENNVITIPNQGPSNARNIGINYASGEYLIFIDSDDYLSKYFIEKLVIGIEEENYDAACCKFEWFKNEIVEINDYSRDIHTVVNNNELAFDIVLALQLLSHCCFIYKSNIINDKKIRYKNNYTYGEDTLFVVEYLTSCTKNVLVMSSKLLHRRIREGSLMSTTKISTSYSTYITDALNSRGEMELLLRLNLTKRSNYLVLIKPRMLLSIINNIALSCSKVVYSTVIYEYDCRRQLKQMFKFPSWKVKIASMLFLLSPDVYRFLLVKLKK